MTARTLLFALAALGAGCSSPPPDDTPDAGTGTPDAGSNAPHAMPFPLVRMNDAEAGTSHANSFQGIVTAHGPARDDQPFPETTAARLLQVKLTDGTVEKLYYTLPVPFAFVAREDRDQVRVLYRERSAGFGASYGARITGIRNELRALFEDGAVGSAFEDSERLGFTFSLDPQKVSEEPDDCGRKVHYPVLVQNGAHKKRLFGGQSEAFTLEDGQNATFTLFDAWRIEDSSCADVPEFSIGYIVTPK